MRLTALVILLLSSLALRAQVKFNGNLEELDSNHMPVGWDFNLDGRNHYEVKLDSIIKKQGKYALSLTRGNGNGSYGVITFPIKEHLHGKILLLAGHIKTENVTNGWAGLWLDVEGKNQKILSFDNMDNNGIKGTTDWKEYMVQVPYNEGEAVTINTGALLVGSGKIWIDSLRLFLDYVPIDKAPISSYKAYKDTSFSHSSKIEAIAVTPQNINRLVLLGQLWGFLKYHHPAIANGDYNWDNELFRIIPKVLNSCTDQQLSATFEKWIDDLGKIEPCTNSQPITSIKDIAFMPDYGALFKNKIFTPALTAKLKYILTNSYNTHNFYIEIGGSTGINPVLTNEKSYDEKASPDAGYRLLGLYRYWNFIQYFSPNRNIIPGGWNNKLAEYIPQFIEAGSRLAYTKTMARLVSSTHDTHAFLTDGVFNDSFGKFRLPFRAEFIEKKLVITGYYKDTLSVNKNVKPGDIIIAINGIPVTKLVERYQPYTSASNKEAALRDMPGSYLLKSNDSVFKISLIRDNKPLSIKQGAVGLNAVDFSKGDWDSISSKGGYYLLNKQIGYLYAGNYKDKDYAGLKKLFVNTRGIIVDLRSYPREDMIGHFANFIKADSAMFVKFTHTFINHPGLFVYSPGGTVGSRTKYCYNGKVVVIVNAQTQSAAEYATMALQTTPNVTVIGSTSAGADGSISDLPLPWFYTYETGHGVYYPDGTNAQGAGVKINYRISPTIKGTRAGRDELLEKAKEIILK